MKDPKSTPTVNEVLDAIDPIAAAEELFGKRHEEFSDTENLQMLSMVMQFNTQKHEIQKGTGDTFMGTNMDQIRALLRETGFTCGWKKNRVSKYGYHEEETIWYSADGFVIYLDTYNSTRPNRFELYGEIDPSHTDETKFNQQYHDTFRVVSGGGGHGLFPQDYEQPVLEKKIYFNADMRSGFKWKTNLARSIGTPLKVWEYTNHFIWFVNYDEEDRYGMGIPHEELFKKKVMEGDEALQRIVGNLLK